VQYVKNYAVCHIVHVFISDIRYKYKLHFIFTLYLLRQAKLIYYMYLRLWFGLGLVVIMHNLLLLQ